VVIGYCLPSGCPVLHTEAVKGDEDGTRLPGAKDLERGPRYPFPQSLRGLLP